MRVLTVAAVSALALGAAACGPHVNYAARTRLDCPDHEGRLTRVSVAPDGKSCLYRSDDVDVNLQLTPVNGDATATLNAIEASLTGPAGAPGQTAAAPAPASETKPSAATSGDAAEAAKQAAADAGQQGGDWNTGAKNSVSVDKGGVHVSENDNGDDDHAHVNLPGLHIDADGNNAKVDIAGVHIDADNGEATIRMVHDVRLRGQAFSREKNGIRATVVIKRDNLPGGYQFVGYEASGPKTGPLTVAIVKSHEDVENGGIYRDIRRLVRRNGGA